MERLKKLTMGLIIAAVSIIAISCDRDELVTENTKTNQKVKVKALDAETQKKIDYLAKRFNIDSDSIKSRNGELIAGCFIFQKDNFWEKYNFNANYKKVKTAHRRSYSQYSQTSLVNPQRIDVNLPPSEGFSSEWISAFQHAVNRWNSLNLSVSFKLTQYNHTTTGINVYYSSNLSSTTDGLSDYPSNGEPGHKIRINKHDSWWSIEPNRNEKKNIAMHELGHTIGLKHTTKTSSSAGAPCHYKTSIMYKDTSENTEFNNCDKATFKHLY